MSTYLLSLVSSLADSGSSSDFTTKFDKPLQFPGDDWEVGLISAEVPNTFYNISAALGNNKFYYNDGAVDHTLTIPDGIWEVDSLNTYIQGADGINGTDIELTADVPRLRVMLTLANSYTVDFTQADTFRSILGFSSAIVSGNGVHYATSKPDITNGNDHFYITCDLVNSTYSRLGGSAKGILYGFTFTVGAGSAQVVVPSEHVHLKLSKTYFDTVNVKIVNQDGRVVDLNGERVAVNIKVKKITPIGQAMF